MSVYRGFVSDIFHAAQKIALEVAERMSPRVVESSFDDSDDCPFVMYMFETPEEQRAAEASYICTLLRALTLGHLENLGCPRSLHSRVEVRILNRIDHPEHACWADR